MEKLHEHPAMKLIGGKYEIGQSEKGYLTLDGEEVATLEQLSRFWGLSQREISRYRSKGLSLHPASAFGISLFRVGEADEWHTQHYGLTREIPEPEPPVIEVEPEPPVAEVEVEVKPEPPVVEVKPEPEPPVVEVKPTPEPSMTRRPGRPESNPKSTVMRKEQALADKAEEDARISALKRKQLEGKLISSEDVDNTIAEMVVIMIAELSDDKKVLPSALQHQDGGFIHTYLDDRYSKRVKRLKKLLLQEYDTENLFTFHNVILKVVERINEGMTPDELIERL